MEFTLRKWQAADAASLTKYANDPRIAANLRDVFPSPYTLADGQAYVADCMEKEGLGQCCRAIVVDGQAVGSIGVFFGNDVYRRSGELGYWLGVPFWGQGIMYQAVRQLCDHVFARYDVCRIYAVPFAGNIGSRRVLEKAGFALEGVLRQSIVKSGTVQDSCVYALLAASDGKENKR